MTTTSHEIFTASGSDIPLQDRDAVAREAVREFRKLQGTLTAYARMLTGNQKMRVEVSSTSNGSTDGERIYYRPPLELGLKPRHDRGKCDKRDKNLELRCEACHAREAVLGVIYHEIAHIAWGSFENVTDADLADFTVEAVRKSEGYYAEQILKRIERAPYNVKCKFMPLAHLISEWLPILLNAIEDARVNRMMFNSRPGTKVMFDAAVRRVMRQGVLQRDKAYIKWCDQPQNIQMIVGAFCIASHYNIKGWFHPKVEQDLRDQELVELLKKVDKLRSVSGSYHLTFPVLVRLRELGYCELPEDPEEPEDDQSGEGSDGSEEGAAGGGEASSESSGGEDSGDEKESSSSSSGGKSSGSGKASGSSSRGDQSDEGEQSPGEEGADSEGTGGTGEQDGGSVPSSDGGSGGGSPESGTEEGGSGGSEQSLGDRDTDDDGETESGEPVPGMDGLPEDNTSESDESTGGGGDETGSEDGETGVGDGAGEDAVPDQIEEPSSNEVDSDSSDSPEGDDDAECSDEQDSSVDDSNSSASGDGSGAPTDDDGTGRQGDGSSPSVDGDSESADSSDDRGEADSESGSNPSDAPGDLQEKDEEAVPLDTGADLGKGGITVLGEEDINLPMGTPAEGKAVLLKLGDHEHDELPTTVTAKREAKKAEEELEKLFGRAIIQSIYFETGSKRVWGVREHYYDKHFFLKSGADASTGWSREQYAGYGYGELIAAGVDGDFDPDESVLAPALMRLRKAFSDNAMGGQLRNRKAGRVDRRSLGKRAPVDDPRVFHKKLEIVKTDDFVEICIDISGSTYGENLVLAKKAALAQCILMHRLGIPFVVYAHSAFHDWRETPEGTNLDIYHVKDEHEQWTDKIATRLKDLCPAENNLDGHSIEYYRKRAEESHAVRRTIMYYTDGKMPAENYDEELEILQREIKICKKLGITLMGVGIRTDSPIKHGLDTVQVDSARDIIKVVQHLEKRLAGR